ncbi:hypothetical protein NEMBOFW57_004480 [Staphylotrichum longicolle]|uniref:Uncharacterized protein n=1 Tax=Staphylotrichum longicolle TaxID=669026 RepID=A0AAD4I0I2_9PEZI|nr:hypothetical protein NEMBOFW57_004480 [Staphylotrichum longicolle]
MDLACQYRKKKDPGCSEERLEFSGLANTLTPTELELFNHYLEHTSKDPSVDSHDQYALQIGIPTLACQSNPLMKSVLALAAVCKCSDLINQTSPSPDESDRALVVHFLSLGHQYHSEALREVQATLHDAGNYDRILANAAMMGMLRSAKSNADCRLKSQLHL